MTNRELYRSTFARVRPDRTWEEAARAAMGAAGRRRRGRTGLAVLAAVLALLAALTTAAVAGNWFGLRELLLPRQQAALPADPKSGARAVRTVDVIGLQGYAGSPESRAMAEWQAFLDGYDRDGALLAQVGNGPTGLEERYALYPVYTQEMADALDEITARYGLSLHTEVLDLFSREDLLAQAGGDFLGAGNEAYSAYLYEDGTFHFDGEVALEGFGVVDYQFMRCVKGSFTDVLLNIGDVTAYREWNRPAADGVPVTLALGPEKALLLADLGDSFVTVNVLAGTDAGGLEAEDLEDLADRFCLSVLTPVRPPAGAAGGDPVSFQARTGVRAEAAEAFYRAFSTAVENGDRETVAGLFLYPRKLTAAGGEETLETPEDLLSHYDALFTESLCEALADWSVRETLAEGGQLADFITHDGMIGAAGGAVWFALVDGELRLLTVQNQEGCSVRYDGPAGVTAG